MKKPKVKAPRKNKATKKKKKTASAIGKNTISWRILEAQNGLGNVKRRCILSKSTLWRTSLNMQMQCKRNVFQVLQKLIKRDSEKNGSFRVRLLNYEYESSENTKDPRSSRQKILEFLKEATATRQSISKSLNIHISVCSDILQDLQDDEQITRRQTHVSFQTRSE